MNLLRLSLVLVILAASTAVLANGAPPPAAVQDPVPTNLSSSSSSNSSARSEAQGTGTGTGTGSAAINDNSSSKTLGIGLSFPGAVQVAPLPSPRDCIVSASRSKNVLLGVYADGDSRQYALKECLMAQQIHALRAACLYGAANKLQTRLIAELGVNDIVLIDDVNLTEQECRDRLKPAEPVKPIALIAPFPEPAPVPPCLKGWKRNSKSVCYDPAWAKQTKPCVPCGKPVKLL